MNPNPPATLARRTLATMLAAVLTAPIAMAQTTDAETIRRLQEENAALRKRIAEFEGRPTAAAPAPATTATPRTTTAAPPAVTTTGPVGTLRTDEGVQQLSAFEVRTDRDYGYLRTNSVTATRIGTEIQRIPLSVSVISDEFIRDANYTDIQDVLRYQSSSAGDTRMGVLQPATGFTPSGNFTLRGFPINSRLRNGLLRYTAYNLDNVDRVEVIKGPAAVFFGQAFPGGVINYVTKKAEFRPLPTTLTYAYGGTTTRMGTERVTLDTNNVFSDKAALRVVGAWDKAKGDRRFEFQDGFSITPNLLLVPFQSGILRVNVEAEYLKRKRNQDDTSWVWPAQWFADYGTPPATLVAAGNQIAPGAVTSPTDVAGFRNWIFGGPGNWIAAVRRANNDQYIPLWTTRMRHGAFITDRAGNRVHDRKFNYYGVGTYSDEETATTSIVTELSPQSWVDLRHSYTLDNSRYTETKSSASPNADGITWNTLNGVLKRDYVLDAYTHQLDVVLKQKLAGVDNKLLLGGVFRQSWTTFTGTNAANLAGTGQFPYFGNLPGSFDKPDEGYVSPIPPQFRSTSFAGNFSQEFVRNREGRILTPVQIFTQYDPAVHPNPDIRRITEVSRGLVDHYKPRRREWYANYQGSALEDRLTGFIGYREERLLANGGQHVDANPPWFTGGPYMLSNIPQPLWAAFGMNEGYQRSQLRDRKGDARMIGASFEVRKGFNVYSSYSETFLPNGPFTLGGDYNESDLRARATQLGLNPATTVSNVAAAGGVTQIRNEKGANLEVGVKTTLWDNRLVSTFSLFRIDRKNRALDDVQRQLDEPLNYTGPNRTGAFSRIVRWYSNEAEQRTEGAEFEAILTPIRNYQALVSGSWIWTAKTVADASLVATHINRPIVFGNRLPFVPEYRLNAFQKYTFTENIIGEYGRGLSIGLGARYASKMTIGLDQNFNPGRGGLTAGNYVVFDTVFGYTWNVLGYNLTTTLNVNNLFDKDYSEGGFNLSAPRSWLLTTGLRF
jgi:outer membrane receptor protein involved in Fe transport